MKSLFEIVKMMGNEANSGISSDLSSFIEVEKSSISAINRANQYIWNSYDFDFKNQTLTANFDGSFITAPVGRIYQIYLDESKISFSTFYENGTRKIDLSDSNKVSGVLKIKYQSICPVKDVDDVEKYNFENSDDVLNVPETLETLYINALLAKSICYLISDKTDESYVPYENAFADAFRLLINSNENHHNPKIII